jgi:hypothetical protein
MYFALLCLLLAGLLLSAHSPDQYGWMMLIGLAWMTGYLDCRRFQRSDQDRDRVFPPDMTEADAPLDDSQLFHP